MRFLFVSRIDDMSETKISGQVTFGSEEPWQRSTAGSQPIISTSVVSEAIGQLVSWLSLRNNDFAARPVFLFATSIDLCGDVAPGTTVDLEAEITDQSPESFIFSGSAKVAGHTVVRITDCGGYLMPLADLEDPAVTRQRFAQLTNGGLPANPGEAPFNYASLVDRVEHLEANQKIVTTKTFSPQEPFYPDHFPRFPVTPIVVINEMIAQATALMLAMGGTSEGVLRPIAVNDLKIKSFVRPGDTAMVTVQKLESFGELIETIAEITVHGRRILRGRYRYELNSERM